MGRDQGASRQRLAESRLLPDPTDVEVDHIAVGRSDFARCTRYESTYGPTSKALPPRAGARSSCPMLDATGRLYSRPASYSTDLSPLHWDAGEPWRFTLEVRQDDRDQWNITGSLRRGEERMELDEPALLLADGFLVAHDSIARFDAGGGFAWLDQLRRVKRIPFPDRERDKVMASLLSLPVVPPLDIDEPLRFEQREGKPRFGLQDHAAQERLGRGVLRGPAADRLRPRAGRRRAPRRAASGCPRSASTCCATRRPRPARDRLCDAARPQAAGRPAGSLPAAHAGDAARRPRAAARGLARGGRRQGVPPRRRHPRGRQLRHRLVRAARRSGLRRRQRHAAAAAGRLAARRDHGAARRRHLRPAARGVAGALRAAGRPRRRTRKITCASGATRPGCSTRCWRRSPKCTSTRSFERVREKLRDFHGVAAGGAARRASSDSCAITSAKASAGWSSCASSASAAAWPTTWASAKRRRCWRVLEARRTEGAGPSLVVAPKSLMFNWRAEAARFTPQLRVLEHTGLARDTALIGESRPGADHLRHAAARRRGARRDRRSITWCWTKRRPSRTRTPPPPRPSACCAARIGWR